MKIIDSHRHFWNKDEVYYHWLTPDAGTLYRNVLPDELASAPAEVVGTVVVQATSSYQESDWLIRQAEENGRISGVVVWADLLADGVEEEIKRMKRCAKLKGIRHQIENEEDKDWMIREDVLRGLGYIRKNEMTFDALIRSDQLWQLDIVCERVEGLPIVLDHCAKPNIAQCGYSEWATQIRRAARLPIYCKLSGLFTEVDYLNWQLDDIRPYSDLVLESFGEDRVMFGSDWPISSFVFMDYEDTVDVTLKLLSNLSSKQKEKILYQNAMKFYKLTQ